MPSMTDKLTYCNQNDCYLLLVALQTHEAILQFAEELTKQMERFYKSDAVALQWLQHRDGERARLESEYSRLQAAVDSCSQMDANLEMDVRNSLNLLKDKLEVGQVLSICMTFVHTDVIYTQL
jgi:hypothetical protein